MLNATCSRGAITCFLITERIENYIYVYVKDLYVHSHFYIGNISQMRHKDTWKSFFYFTVSVTMLCTDEE